MSRRFSLGRLLTTPGAARCFESTLQLLPYLARHAQGDWGDLCDADKRANDKALKSGARLLSAYDVENGPRIWIITEAADEDGAREATTVLLPEEY